MGSLEQQCLDASELLQIRHGWRLISRDELARRAVGYLRAGEADSPHRAVIFAYSHVLHRACSGLDGAGPQNTGYAELFHYLHEIAVWRYADVAEEAAQGALVSVFTNHHRCRQPGTFLAFAIQHLLNAARAARRQQDSLHAARAVGDTAPIEDISDPTADLTSKMITHELRERFMLLEQDFLRRHPRARRQLEALRMKYVDGLDEAVISKRLGVPARSLYVLRSRAMAKLRADPAWHTLAVEFGIIAGE